MKHPLAVICLFLLTTLACGESATIPAAREVYPEGEPGTATIHEPGWRTPIKLPFNDDGWEDSPSITRDGSQIIIFYHPYPDLISAME